MINKRPININPLSVQIPIGALVSITHRLSGILVFLLIPMILWAMQLSFESEQSFEQMKAVFDILLLKAVTWIFLAALLYHLVAGLRHLLMDVHIGDSLRAGRLSAKIVIIVSLLLAIEAAYWLWR